MYIHIARKHTKSYYFFAGMKFSFEVFSLSVFICLKLKPNVFYQDIHNHNNII